MPYKSYKEHQRKEMTGSSNTHSIALISSENVIALYMMNWRKPGSAVLPINRANSAGDKFSINHGWGLVYLQYPVINHEEMTPTAIKQAPAGSIHQRN